MKTSTNLTGMTGVYLAAAELSNRGFIVSPTSRSARGADLLVTDQGCQRAWSVQVKTNHRKKNSWRLTETARSFNSDSHIYIFVNLTGDTRPEYTIAPSSRVVDKMKGDGTQCYVNQSDLRSGTSEGWELFGDSVPKNHRRNRRRNP